MEASQIGAARAEGRARTAAEGFVGRAVELDELRRTLGEAASGRGRLVLVTGEPGIGKTRLIEQLLADAVEQGWQIFSGQCWEEGGAPAYWPWIQIVRAAGGDFERLAAPTSTGLTSVAMDPESTRFALFDAVTGFLTDASRTAPTVLVLEDLHAADSASLLLLRFLSETSTRSRILVVGSYRDGERQVQHHAELFAALARIARRVPLGGLDVDEVGAYVAGAVGPVAPAAAQRLRRVTDGNPFFLGEVLRLLVVDWPHDEPERAVSDLMLRVPEEVRTLVRRRVAGLSTEAIAELHVAAVIGRNFELRLLEQISPLNATSLVDVLEEAVVAGVLVAGTTRGMYAFVHELMREILYEDLPPSRRLELHLEIGTVIERLAQQDLDPHLSEIAHHLALATPLGDVQKAVNYLARAGERSAALAAYEEAAIHYERALQLLGAAEAAAAEQRGNLLLRLGDVCWRGGDGKAAAASFEEATDVARRLGDGEMLARAALGYVSALGGFLLFARFEVGATGAGLLDEALAALPEDDSPLRARLLAHLAIEVYSANEPIERRVGLSDAALDMARRLDDAEALVTALHAHHWALASPDLARERLTHTDEMLDVARETATPDTEFLAHNARFHCYLELCEGRRMAAETEAMVDLAELVHQPVYVWHTICLHVVRAALDGRFDDAERFADEALEIERLRHSGYFAYVFQFAQMFTIRWAQGRLAELWPTVQDHGERFPWVPRWREALAAAELGDVKAAHVELERHAARDFADLPQDGLWLLHLCSLAEVCVLIDDRRRGRQLYDLLLPYAERNAVSYTQQPFGPVALRLAMLARLLSRWEEAQHHLATAVERCQLLGARAILARVLHERAQLLLARRADGDDAAAQQVLDEASRLCEEFDMWGLRERIDATRKNAESAARAAAVFHREGDFWAIGYEGATFRLRDLKGLRYIALLLAQPGREFHVLKLVQAVDGQPLAGAHHDLAAMDLHVSSGDAIPVLDEQAKEAYRRRLTDLGEDLDEAREWNDPERVAFIESEIDALTDELSRAAGLGGRDRELPSPAERARVSVTKAIRAAIRAIARHSGALGSHLEGSIRTGRFCSYAPRGLAPPEWTL